MTEHREPIRKIYALGETVLDLVCKDGINFRAVPGGSVLNASVSLGRMNSDVYLISEFGNDRAGNLIDDFLKRNGVNTDYCIRYQQNKTPLALAFLDEHKKASYTFYHDSPNEPGSSLLPEFGSTDVLLLGSYYAVKATRHELVTQILQQAADAGSVIYYDLNIRKAHEGELDKLKPSFTENMAAATIVKGSDEDFMYLFGLSDPEAIYEKVQPYCKFLILTNGARPVKIYSPAFTGTYQVPELLPVSTIGAGDNFNAGFIYGLINSNLEKAEILTANVERFNQIVASALAFATETCLSAENYIPRKFEPDFWKRYI